MTIIAQPSKYRRPPSHPCWFAYRYTPPPFAVAERIKSTYLLELRVRREAEEDRRENTNINDDDERREGEKKRERGRRVESGQSGESGKDKKKNQAKK